MTFGRRQLEKSPGEEFPEVVWLPGNVSGYAPVVDFLDLGRTFDVLLEHFLPPPVDSEPKKEKRAESSTPRSLLSTDSSDQSRLRPDSGLQDPPNTPKCCPNTLNCCQKVGQTLRPILDINFDNTGTTQKFHDNPSPISRTERTCFS